MRSLASTLLVLAALMCCKSSEPGCKTVTGSVPGTLDLSACDDGQNRQVHCTNTMPDGAWACACQRGKHVGRTFGWPASASAWNIADRRELEDRLRRHCHWDLSLR